MKLIIFHKLYFTNITYYNVYQSIQVQVNSNKIYCKSCKNLILCENVNKETYVKVYIKRIL